jgi:hypothetical protein
MPRAWQRVRREYTDESENFFVDVPLPPTPEGVRHCKERLRAVEPLASPVSEEALLELRSRLNKWEQESWLHPLADSVEYLASYLERRCRKRAWSGTTVLVGLCCALLCGVQRARGASVRL